MKNRFFRLLHACLIYAALGLTGLFGSTRPPTNCQTRESVTVPTAVAFDLQGYIEARVAAGDATITIPRGRHLVTPRAKQHLLLKGLRNLVIDATGAELVCSETTRAITIEKCENLTLRGLVIDYDPLPFTQARIIDLSKDKTRVELERIPGYAPMKSNPVKLETFDPRTNELRGRITFYGISLESHGDTRATLTRPPGTAAASIDQVGDIAVLYHDHAPGGAIPHAIMATDSRALVFERVVLYAGPTFGFFENACDGSRYIECRVDRRPAHLDHAERDHPRLRSVNADAYHSKNARQGPVYQACLARYNGDDSIAINGDFHFVVAAEGATLRVLAKLDMTMRVGDVAQIFTHDGRRLPDRKIIALARAGIATAAERALVETRGIEKRLLARSLSEAWTITFDAPVADTPTGSLIASADAIGNGFAIRNCTLGHNRSRGILLKAGRGEITGNTLSGSVMSTILVAPEYFWLEAGFSDELLIARNTLRDIRGPGIVVTVFAPDNQAVAPVGAFRNLVIRDNTVSGGPAPGLLVTSVDGLTHENNRVAVDHAKDLSPWEIKSWGQNGIQPVMIQKSR